MRILLGGKKVERINGVRHIVKCAGTEVFKCQIPGCKTYKLRELAVGDLSICWRCNGELLLTMKNTMMKKPVHEECRRSVITESDNQDFESYQAEKKYETLG